VQTAGGGKAPPSGVLSVNYLKLVLFLAEKNPAADSEKLFNANFIYVVFLNTVTHSSFQMVNPILSKYVVSLGASLTIGGLVVGILAITAVFARPVSGAISDRLNSKYVMIISTIAMAGLSLCYLFPQSVGVLVLIRVLHGIAFAGCSTSNTALATMFIPPRRMGEGIGYLGFSIVLASAIGPWIGLKVVETFGYRVNFLISFAITALNAVLMCLVRYKHKKQERTGIIEKFRLSDFVEIKLIPIAVFAGVFTFAFSAINAFIAVMGDERNIANIGIYFILNSVMLLAIRPLSGKINDKQGLAIIVIPSFIFSALAMYVLAEAYSVFMVALAAVLMSIGYGSALPGLQAEGIRLLPEKRGVASSTHLIGLDVGHGLGSIVGGAALASFGFTTMYLGVGVLLILGMVWFILRNRRVKRV